MENHSHHPMNDMKHKTQDHQPENELKHISHTHHNENDQHPSHHSRENQMSHTSHDNHDVDHSGHEIMFRRRFWFSLIMTIPVLLFSPMIQQWFGFSIPAFPASRFVGPLFALAIFFYGGLPFIQMAIPELQRHKPGMMLLISLAITVAFLYSVFAVFYSPESGFFWEMATLIDIMLLGHWIEMRSVRQASGSMNELAKLMPDTAERIIPDGDSETVPVTHLVTGDLVLIRPGASIPADGEVADGRSKVNEAMITGESRSIEKKPGDRVIGGTINEDGSLRVKITATGNDTTLAGIMLLVKQAQQSKSDTQILADKAAGWLFYIALACAMITAIAWTISIGFKIEVLERVVTVLVIACPHALGLAIPLVVAISTSLGARNGILVRDRLALEKARQLDIIVFDKTGTLTQGEFGVVNMAVTNGQTQQDALALAAAIESDSEHLIARGIRRKAEEERSIPVPITNFEAIKGRGIKAFHKGAPVYVGGPQLLEMLNITADGVLEDFTRQSERKGQSVIYLIKDGLPTAAFALADVIRQESKRSVNRLQEMGIEVAMLTGDSRAVASSVAEELGITTIFAEVLPEYKDQKITELQHRGKKVAMIGDGVNDAPALTRADVGIAIGSGTDVAIESAGIILVRSNPLDIVKIITLSQATYRKMIQNLIWATTYNIVAIPLAAGVLTLFGSKFILSPAVGALFMSLSTIIVAFNAQLLRRIQLSE